MDSLRALLTEKGFDFAPQMDGAYHRFDRGGKSLAGWFRGWELKGPDGIVLYQEACFGDWVTRERYEWKGEDATTLMTAEQLAEVKRLRAEAIAARQEEKERRRSEVAVEAKRMYAAARPVDSHEYLRRKGVGPGPNTRLLGDKLVVPIYSGTEGIVNLQMIAPTKDGQGKDKKFLSGGRVKGCWGWTAPRPYLPGQPDTLYIAEGFATAQSIAEILDSPVLIAFNASNLSAVCSELFYQPKRVVICADNDQFTEGNPGIAEAHKARRILQERGIAAEVVAPDFEAKDLEKRPTDWNDSHQLYGGGRLKEVLAGGRTRVSSSSEASNPERPTGLWPVEAPSPLPPPARASLPALENFRPIPIRKNDDGDVIPPTQLQVVNLLLEHLAEPLLREGREVFLWCGTHWEEQDPINFKFYVKRAAMRILHGKAKEKELNDIYSLFIGYLDSVPPGQSFYRQDPRLANFRDGTLEIVRAKHAPHGAASSAAAGGGAAGAAAGGGAAGAAAGGGAAGAGVAAGAEGGEARGGALCDDGGARVRGQGAGDPGQAPGSGGGNQECRGRYELRFRAHARGDLCTWVLPYEYGRVRRTSSNGQGAEPRSTGLQGGGETQGGASGSNLGVPGASASLFRRWLGRCFEGDADGGGKIRALQQVGGACLVSLFPRYVFLHGPGGTGKSTFAKLCMRFLSPKNVCSVAPKDQEGFGKEVMIGKQANIVTDISGARVDSALFKRSEDRVPEYINRKGRQAVFGFLPALDLYCSNELPRGIDGDSSAMDRRVTIVEFTQSVVQDGNYERDYDLAMLEDAPEEILDFFLAGLEDLCNSGGIYFNPESGKARLRIWKDSESVTAQFLDALSHGEVANLELAAKGKILKVQLAAALDSWAGKDLNRREKGRLYAELEKRGYVEEKQCGVRYVTGIQVKGAPMVGAAGQGF